MKRISTADRIPATHTQPNPVAVEMTLGD